jgi:hypothetical protein
MPKIYNPLVKQLSSPVSDAPQSVKDSSKEVTAVTASFTTMIIKFSKKNTINLGNYENTSIELGVEIPLIINPSNTLSENLRIFRQSLSKISSEVEDALKEKTDEIANI